MSKIDENLDEILNVNPAPKQDIVTLEPIADSNNHVVSDYELSRQTIRNLVSKGEDALNELLFVAKKSESPRAYEVVSGMIKNISDVTKELIDLQKKMKQLDEEPSKSSIGVNVQNAVFVGTTAELQRIIKQSKDNG